MVGSKRTMENTVTVKCEILKIYVPNTITRLLKENRFYFSDRFCFKYSRFKEKTKR